ncbi:hypothetical protein JL722_3485 [Aureococcus anophagefferens]|nr:hypothetical protein JL722_3485 [Aureococcus anophagefferens]
MPYVFHDVTGSLINVGVGILMKWMLGSDDLVWLAPFMARGQARHKCRMAFKYVVSVAFLTLVACGLGAIVTATATSGSGDAADEAVGTIAGALLLASPSTWRATRATERCAPEEGGGGGGGDEAPSRIEAALATSLKSASDAFDGVADVALCGSGEAGDGQALLKDPDRAAKAQKDIVVVAFLGSLDDFMVYFALSLSGKITWLELFLGVTIGAVAIALVVGTLLEASEALSDLVENVPVPLVLALVAVYIVASSWVPALEIS